MSLTSDRPSPHPCWERSFCKDVLAMTDEDCQNVFFDTLSHIGLSPEEIDQANDMIFGYGSIEGAPGLKKEHLPVFDCATPWVHSMAQDRLTGRPMF